MRTTAERLIAELDAVRGDLHCACAHIQDLDWAPTADMKSCRALLKEIGAIQAETYVVLTEKRIPRWEDAEGMVRGTTTEEVLDSLDETLGAIKRHLSKCSDADLCATVAIPDDWVDVMGAKDMELEEFVRWIARHEYYHVGQIVSYNWVRGLNPYKV